MILALALAVFVLVSSGVYLMLQRSLTRIVLGFGLLGHGANLLILGAGGRALNPPFVGATEPFSDPLAQAMILTAIVIGFGMTGFLLTLAYRSWKLRGTDDVEDDLEDRRIAQVGRHPRWWSR